MDLRILVSRADRIGDLVLTLPAIAWLKKTTGAHVTLHCSAYAKDIGLWAQYNGVVDELIWRDPTTNAFCGITGAYTHGISFFHSPEVRDLFRQVRVSATLGPRTKISSIFTYSKTIAQHRSQVKMSEMTYNVALAKAAARMWGWGDADFVGLPKLQVPESWKQGIMPPRGLVVSLSNGGSAQNWSLADYLGWVEQNAAQDPIDFLVAGLDAKLRRLELLDWSGFDADRHRVVESLPSVGNLVAYLSMATRLVASSTGPLHIAHAAGVNVLGIYPCKKAESFERWRPDGYWHGGEIKWIEISP